MRIVIDMQGAQTESRFRGIGRYTLGFAQGVARNRGQHDIILALSGLFPETIEPLRAAFDGLLPQENIRIWHAPGPVRELEPGNGDRRVVAELIREAFLASLQPDVIHVCSLFEGFVDDAVTSVGRFDTTTPVILTLYDLIPLLNPDQFLKPNPRYAAHYERKIQFLKQAKLLLSISESARLEGLNCLGLDATRIVNVSTAIGPEFRIVSVNEGEARALREKIGLSRPFVLYTGGADQHKNLPRLIQAWSALPTPLRQTHQLLFAGKMPEGCVAEYRHIAATHKLRPDELCFSGYISDEDLVRLFNLCALYVFPSWHEGFGLPALEAMACGAPVIGSNAASLPEVIGLEEALFNPFEPTEITEMMTRALVDEEFRTLLREHGLRQAQRFSWDATAQRALTTFELATRVEATPMQNRSWRSIKDQLDRRYAALIEGIAGVIGPGPSEDDLARLAHCIAENAREVDPILRATRPPEHLRWRIEGPFDSSYSLALLNRELARALAGLGHEVVLFSTEGPGDFAPDAGFLARNPDLAAMHGRATDLSALEADVVSRNLYPPRVLDMAGRVNLLHAYGWEETGFPGDWVDAFNDALQGMLLTSEQVRKTMIDNGVSVPLAVSGDGVDHWEHIASDGDPGLPRTNGFRFLHVSSCFPRKGADVLLAAYGRAFRAADDVTLIIKTFANPHNEIHRWLEEARAGDAGFPQVMILEEDFSDARLKALYAHCQVLVAPSRGEGFGLPMAEAMLSGLAVITTGWGGQVDFCTPKTAWLVDYRFEPARTHFGVFDSVWAEPDVAHLARLMREVHELPAAARAERAAAGRSLLLARFRWSDVARRSVEAARRWARAPERPQPRVGWVTTWGTRCGIAGYSAHLVRALPRTVTLLAARAEGVVDAAATQVRRCWTAGDGDALQDLRQAVAAAVIDTLVIQFNYGFFAFEAFAAFLIEQAEAGRVVVVMMHATTDPASQPWKRLAVLAPALARCQRVLVHAPGDLNRLKALGLVANVALFPHGILDWAPPAHAAQPAVGVDRADRDWLIASYGFFLPHKGLPQLVDALGLLRAQGLPVRLRMVNAEYPVPQSGQVIAQVREQIEALGLGASISLHTDYLPDDDSLRLLSDADLIVFPHQETAESSSAAVRYGIASGRPVAVTPLPIFADVASAVHPLPGTSAHAIADGIAGILHRLRDADPVLAEQARTAERWRAAHRYSRVARRLDGMLVALHRAAGAAAMDRGFMS